MSYSKSNGLTYAVYIRKTDGSPAVLLLGFWLIRRIVGSPLGHAFVGIRENETRMRAIGYPVRAYKLASFVAGGALAGFAGAVYGIFNGFISPDALKPGFHCTRTHWIRGFMTFQLAGRIWDREADGADVS